MSTRYLNVTVSAMALAAMSSAPIVGLGGAALAQESASEIAESDKLVVTARKREESIQDVPSTLSAFGEDDIARFEISTLEDLESLIVGAEFIGSNGNPFANEIIIRGGGVGRFLNVDGGTGIYANGINVQGGNFGGRSLWDVDTFDVQRFEVLKGPQGALYGRNALGGSINAISKKPNLSAASATVKAGIYDNEGYSLGTFVDAPIVEDVFGLRLAVEYFDQEEGFYFNPVTDDFIDATEEIQMRAAALWRLNENWDAHVQIDYYDTEREGSSTYNVVATQDPFERDLDDLNRGEKTEESYYAALRGDLDWAQLAFIVNHREREGSRTFDQDEGVAADPFDPAAQVFCFSTMMGAFVPPNQRCTSTAGSVFDRTTVEARLSGETDRFDWIVGADWFDSFDDFFQTVRGRNFADRDVSIQNDTTSWSIFGGTDFEVTDRFTVGGELRYTTEDKDLASLAVLTIGVTQVDTELSETFEYITWTASATYELTPSALVFGRAGTGFRTGGLNLDGRDIVVGTETLVTPDTFDEESAISYELGLKTAFLEDALIWNTAVFYVDYEDFISNGNNGLTGLDRVNFVTNVGDADLIGAEAEVKYVTSDLPGGSRLDVRGGVAYMDGEIDVSLPELLAEDSSFPPVGDQISRVPEWSFTASAKLDVPLPKDLTGFGSLKYSGQMGGQQNFQNTADLPEPHLLDLQVGIAGESWRLSGNVRNLTDSDEPIRAISPTSNLAVAREPRTWWVTFTKTFGG